MQHMNQIISYHHFFKSESQKYCLWAMVAILVDFVFFNFPPPQNITFNVVGFAFSIQNAIFFGQIALIILLMTHAWLGNAFTLIASLATAFVTFYLSQKLWVVPGRPFGVHDHILIFWTLFFFTITNLLNIGNIKNISLLVLASALCGAGISKLMATGVNWGNTENTRCLLLYRGLVTGNPWAMELSKNTFFTSIGGHLFLALELFALPLALITPLLFSIFTFVFFIFDFTVLELKIFLIFWSPNLMTFMHSYVQKNKFNKSA